MNTDLFVSLATIPKPSIIPGGWTSLLHWVRRPENDQLALRRLTKDACSFRLGRCVQEVYDC